MSGRLPVRQKALWFRIDLDRVLVFANCVLVFANSRVVPCF